MTISTCPPSSKFQYKAPQFCSCNHIQDSTVETTKQGLKSNLGDVIQFRDVTYSFPN